MMLKKFLIVAGCISMGALSATTHAASEYPNKSIHLTVPFAAGGVTDLTARTFAKQLSGSLKQPVIVENRPGAGATIGANHVAKSSPDGYTLLLGTNVTHAITPQMMEKAPYNPLEDFQPIAMFGLNGNVLLVQQDFPANTFEEFIEYLRSNKNELNYASGSIGSSAHLAAELLKIEVDGIEYTHIPFGGPSEAMSALIGGHVDFMFTNIGAAVSQTKSGKVKALAVTTAKRTKELPNVPTIAESGVPGFEVVGWLAAFAPKNTPAATTQKLNALINASQENTELRKTLDTASVIPVIYTPEETAAFVKNEYEKWGNVIRAAKIPKM